MCCLCISLEGSSRQGQVQPIHSALFPTALGRQLLKLQDSETLVFEDSFIFNPKRPCVGIRTLKGFSGGPNLEVLALKSSSYMQMAAAYTTSQGSAKCNSAVSQGDYTRPSTQIPTTLYLTSLCTPILQPLSQQLWFSSNSSRAYSSPSLRDRQVQGRCPFSQNSAL